MTATSEPDSTESTVRIRRTIPKVEMVEIPTGETAGDTPTSDPDDPMVWMESAHCKGATHLMFPNGYKDISYIAQARAICGECVVREPCLDYALTFPAGDMHGVWGGLTPRQLAAEQRRRGIRPTVPTLAQLWGEVK